MTVVPSLTAPAARAIVPSWAERHSAKETGSMSQRSFRGLLWTFAIAGFLADQGTKYGMFRWLYSPSLEGQRDIVPGKFRFIAQFTRQPVATEGWRAPFQAFNGPYMPRVNNGALFDWVRATRFMPTASSGWSASPRQLPLPRGASGERRPVIAGCASPWG